MNLVFSTPTPTPSFSPSSEIGYSYQEGDFVFVHLNGLYRKLQFVEEGEKGKFHFRDPDTGEQLDCEQDHHNTPLGCGFLPCTPENEKLLLEKNLLFLVPPKSTVVSHQKRKEAPSPFLFSPKKKSASQKTVTEISSFPSLFPGCGFTEDLVTKFAKSGLRKNYVHWNTLTSSWESTKPTSTKQIHPALINNLFFSTSKTLALLRKKDGMYQQLTQFTSTCRGEKYTFQSKERSGSVSKARNFANIPLFLEILPLNPAAERYLEKVPNEEGIWKIRGADFPTLPENPLWKFFQNQSVLLFLRKIPTTLKPDLVQIHALINSGENFIFVPELGSNVLLRIKDRTYLACRYTHREKNTFYFTSPNGPWLHKLSLSTPPETWIADTPTNRKILQEKNIQIQIEEEPS